MAIMLKAEPYNCDLIVALTHMRCPEDRILAQRVPEIDFILGGHDHSYLTEVCQSTGVFIIKSGTDFEEFSDFKVFLEVSEADFAAANLCDTKLVKHLFSKQKNILVIVEKVLITDDIPQNEEMVAHVQANSQKLSQRLDQICGYIDVDIEGRFDHLRFEETNCANFISDLIRT